MKGAKVFLGVVLGLVLFSWALVPVVGLLDIWTVYNPRPAHPLHLFAVFVAGGVMFWAMAPTLSLPLLGGILAVVAGATSNLLWRIAIGPVPDYIPFPFGAYGNLADLLIFVGGPLYIISIVVYALRSRKLRREQERCLESEVEPAAR